ncbi:Hsp20/alpha crystallin family protein [Dactylosporangium sp. NPDC049525]|uniref:Hsp20/alpha crystallin family protein n=1 Tax=Dactylosporangium sp. NPDC049525 TaxID=3154730 RepID=UPI00344AE6D9
MPLNRWNPSDALARIESEVDHAASHAHSASVNTSTEGDDLVITVDGVDPSDVDVQVSGGRLTIKGGGGTSTSEHRSEGGATFSSSSSSSSSFSRSFSLPDGVTESDVSTTPSANGVTVRIHNAA